MAHPQSWVINLIDKARAPLMVPSVLVALEFTWGLRTPASQAAGQSWMQVILVPSTMLLAILASIGLFGSTIVMLARTYSRHRKSPFVDVFFSPLWSHAVVVMGTCAALGFFLLTLFLSPLASATTHLTYLAFLWSYHLETTPLEKEMRLAERILKVGKRTPAAKALLFAARSFSTAVVMVLTLEVFMGLAWLAWHSGDIVLAVLAGSSPFGVIIYLLLIVPAWRMAKTI
jgi:hypothetical protein